MRHARMGMVCCALGAGLLVALAGCPAPPGGGGNQNTPPAGNNNTNTNTNGGVAPCPLDGDPLNVESVEAGRVQYEGRRCINCHGFDGSGTVTFPGAPTVQGRTACDIAAALIEACDDSTPQGAGSIQCRHPIKMPDLSDPQLTDLEAYIETLVPLVPEDPGPPCTDTSGEICTIVGNGVQGTNRQTVMARRARLFWPQNVDLDPQGRLVVTDWNNYLIRRVENTGCAPAEDGGMDCPLRNIIGTGGLGDSCTSATTPILGTAALMNHPVGVLYDDFINGQNNILLWGWHQWKIKYIPVNADGSTGEMYCLFGNARGTGAENIEAGFGRVTNGQMTLFDLPSSCVYDNVGNFYISDQANLRIRIVEADDDDDNSSPAMFVQSRLNNNIRTYAGGLRQDCGEAEPTNCDFRRTLPDYSDSGDGGPASECTFNCQFGFDAIPQMRLDLDRDRNILYVADSENNRIRVIDLNTGVIDLFAGGGTDVVADNVPATQVQLNAPADVDIQPGTGNLLITDTFNHCVRLVDISTDPPMIRTVAGECNPNPTNYYDGDGGPATMAHLQEPSGAYIAEDGTIYVADTLNHRVRRINP